MRRRHDVLVVCMYVASVARNKSHSSRCRQPQGRDKMEMHCALCAHIYEYTLYDGTRVCFICAYAVCE